MNKFEAMRAFCLVADEGSFAAAAAVLNVSPTMVSRHIKQLEAHLGCLLLKRNTRKVYLTSAGEQYRQHIKPLLKRLTLIENQITELDNAPAGKLSLSTSIEFGGIYLAPLLQSYKAQFPQVELDITLSNTPIDLFDSQIDLVLRPAPSLPNASHIAQPVCHSTLSLWASPRYLAQHGTPQKPIDLKNHSLLFFKHSIRKDHWLFQQNGSRNALKLQWQLVSDNGRLLNEAAANDMGIIQAPSYSVAPFVINNQLVEIMTQYRITPLTISAIYPHRYALSSRIKSFVTFAKQYFVENPIP